MSYHIVSIDAHSCSLSCKSGQLTCTAEGHTNTVPLEDVAAIVITSFSASIHSKLLLEAAKHGVGMVICEQFKPASLVLPANRATDTLLTRAQVELPSKIRDRLWAKTVDAKVGNQLSLAKHLSVDHPQIPNLDRYRRSKRADKESIAARSFWQVYRDALNLGNEFRRGRNQGNLNPLLNYGYAILLSTVLQKCFALGIDPTFGIFHQTRENSTPLGYDLMEPFRPCVDWRVAQWVRNHPETDQWNVNTEFRRWVTGFPLVKTDYLNLELELRGCIEGVIRSFRKSVIEQKAGLYTPWTQGNSKWAG